MPTIVCKFGGTSLRDLPSLQKVISIIEKDDARRYIVVSAPGKRFDGDEKITDLFFKAHLSIEQGDKNGFARIFAKIRSRYESFACPCVFRELDEIERNIQKGESLSYALSRGEYLMAKILSSKLQIPMLDTESCLFIERGKTLYKSYRSIQKALPNQRTVLPGFYGRGTTGVAVYPRGGGDITGGVVAKSTKADAYENWTDVCGVRACDPAYIKDAVCIPSLSYGEIRTLATSGASVLHEDAVLPLRKMEIPVYIKNTFDEQGESTTVCKSVGARTGIAGIAVKKTEQGSLLTAVDERIAVETLKKRLLDSFQTEKLPVFKAGTTNNSAFLLTTDWAIRRAVQTAYQTFY